jgi:lipopolysaccharide transport system ATP-binding protein
MTAVVRVQNLCKAFSRREQRRGMAGILSGMFSPRESEKLWALRDISFEVKAGEMLGIVGANGAGKSTLLRMLGGVGRPTGGELAVSGRIGALLDLGGGFQGDLSGRENAIIAAVVAGLLRQEALDRMDEIVGFAELEDFIDAPVRTYSTGMTMRLAFAVAVHTEPDVMLVDEFLSVGDLAFQAKCINRISELRARGCAIVLVSHSMDQIRERCDRAIWLRKGQVVCCDDSKTVAEAYEREMREETLRRTPKAPPLITNEGVELRAGENRMGSLEVEITSVAIRPGTVITSGGPLVVEVCYNAAHPVVSPVFTVSISRDDGTICMDTNTQASRVEIPDLEGSGRVSLRIERLDLVRGDYFVNVGVFTSNWNHACDFHWHVYQLTVEGGNLVKGVLSAPCDWSIKRDAASAR